MVDITGDHSGIIYGISDSDDGALFAVDAAGNLSFVPRRILKTLSISVLTMLIP